jgi:hypothetical protein
VAGEVTGPSPTPGQFPPTGFGGGRGDGLPLAMLLGTVLALASLAAISVRLGRRSRGEE